MLDGGQSVEPRVHGGGDGFAPDYAVATMFTSCRGKSSLIEFFYFPI